MVASVPLRTFQIAVFLFQTSAKQKIKATIFLQHPDDLPLSETQQEERSALCHWIF